jgi:hypothetical protein
MPSGRGLLHAGYIEGRHVVLEWQHAHGNRLQQLAFELLQRSVVISSVIHPQSGRETRHVHYPNRHGPNLRSSRIWPGRKPRPSWRKR